MYFIPNSMYLTITIQISYLIHIKKYFNDSILNKLSLLQFKMFLISLNKKKQSSPTLKELRKLPLSKYNMRQTGGFSKCSRVVLNHNQANN